MKWVSLRRYGISESPGMLFAGSHIVDYCLFLAMMLLFTKVAMADGPYSEKYASGK